MYFNEEYYVNEEKKVVVCKLTDCSDALIYDLCKRGIPSPFECSVAEEFFIPNEYVGKATCSNDDVFDADKGRKIAFKRAYAKLTKAKKRVLNDFMKDAIKAHEFFVGITDRLNSHYDAVITRKTEEVKYIAEN